MVRTDLCVSVSTTVRVRHKVTWIMYLGKAGLNIDCYDSFSHLDNDSSVFYDETGVKILNSELNSSFACVCILRYTLESKTEWGHVHQIILINITAFFVFPSQLVYVLVEKHYIFFLTVLSINAFLTQVAAFTM